jgi:hypothetical protein
MDKIILVKGETGSGKTELVINKAGEYVANYHRVFHVVPLNSLKFNVYSRYRAKYGDKVSPSYRHDAKIYVLTYHEYAQALTTGLNTYYDVIAFDEFHVIAEDIFRPVVYASLVNTKQFYHLYFISATPVDLPFIKFDEVIELSGRKSQYRVFKIEKDDYADVVLNEYRQGNRGFVYVGGVESTKKVATEIADKLPNIYNEEFDTDDRLLGNLLKKGIAFINSSMSHDDRKLVNDLLNDGTVKLLTVTSAIVYGVDFDFDYGVFITPVYLNKLRAKQFFGRVGRRKEGRVYVTFYPDMLSGDVDVRIRDEDRDFAELIALNVDYICRKYGICDGGTVKTIAYNLVPPSLAKRVIDSDIRNFEDVKYMECVTVSLYKQSLVADKFCAEEFGLFADADIMSALDSWVNLKGTMNPRLVDELSYLAHIVGVLKNPRFEDFSIAVKFGVPYDSLKELVPLMDLPYIGRYRAYQLYKEGVTLENLCEKREKVVKILGGWGKKVLKVVCGGD